ncbi:hypothetical protein I4U23_004848 [Adineta vaga]|nr:hypothetical protein I4U23_004848 [Adineta vaga]
MKQIKRQRSDSFDENDRKRFLTMASSIEHLIIDHGVDFNELTAILSCTSRLRHLAVLLWHKNDFRLISPCHVLNYLTHVSLNLCSEIKFDDLKMFFINYSPFVQVLRVNVHEEYIDANKWKQLLSSSLPNLRIFDIHCEMGSQLVYFNRKNIEKQMNLFNSSFWTQRQWFFEYHLHLVDGFNHSIFRSTNPYRRKKYNLCNESIQVTNNNHFQTVFKSVDHVHIINEKALNQSMFCFPYVNKLTLGWKLSIHSSTSIISKIHRILPLKQIQILKIEYNRLGFQIMCELLSFMPNLRTLKLRSIIFEKIDKLSIEQNEIFQLISKTNLIQHVILNEQCTLQKLELLLKLVPRVQCLQLSIQLDDMEMILEFLLNKNNKNTRHLVLLGFLSLEECYFRYLNQLIRSKTFLYDFKITYADYDNVLYMWW